MSVILHGIVIVLLMLLGIFVCAVLVTLIVCPISDFFGCRKLYHRVRDISCGCNYLDTETYEKIVKPIYCTCREKDFKVEVKQAFSCSCYDLDVMNVYINNELAATVWKSESLFLKHYSHHYATQKNCVEVEEIIKSAQKVASKMWHERIKEACKRDSYFE